jgi:protein-tyrosine phosphatase
MIDLHCHILYGIDDGPATIEDSLELAHAAIQTGIDKIVATPHVSWQYNNDSSTISRLTAELNSRLESEGMALQVLSGGEIAMTYAIELAGGEIGRLGLGASRWLLVEPPFTPVASNLDAVLLNLQRDGHRILLAHPERCSAFHRDPKMLGTLVREGILTSITAGALVGRFGEQVRRFALQLAREEMIHNVASDAHDSIRRPPGIASELERSGLGPLTGWLTEDVPAAILNDQPIPSRPAVSHVSIPETRRPWWRPSFRRAS